MGEHISNLLTSHKSELGKPVPMSPCMFMQLFKLLSAEGVRQLASKSGRENKYNNFTP